MRLGLSSAVAADADLEELLAACARRGLAALELCAGNAHGVTVNDPLSGRRAARRARASGVVIGAYRASADDDVMRIARLAEALAAPVLMDGTRDLERARYLADLGVPVYAVVRGCSAVEVADAIAAAGLALAWDATPADAPIGAQAQTLLSAHGDRLRHITLLGGGPEAVTQEGRGVGELMGWLALSGFTGTVALAPGNPRYHVAWQAWLGRRGGWGCGSKSADRTLVNLASGAS